MAALIKRPTMIVMKLGPFVDDDDDDDDDDDEEEEEEDDIDDMILALLLLAGKSSRVGMQGFQYATTNTKTKLQAGIGRRLLQTCYPPFIPFATSEFIFFLRGNA